MAPLLGLEDPSHEKFAETKENAKAPFLRIPLEIRLLIYEFATHEGKPIAPKQLAARSNKFSSGITYKAKKGSKPKNRKLFISDLVRVSRQIYVELENNPVFYRVNKFRFPEPGKLLDFLVAITPERRAFLRHAVVQFIGANAVVMLPGLGDPLQLWTEESAEVLKHVAALLSRCKDLRHLEMRLHSLVSWDYDSMIQKFTQQITSGNLRNTLWSLPCIEPSFVNRQGRGIDLMATQIEESSAIDAPDLSERTIELVAEAKTALVSLRQHLKDEERNGNGFWDQYSNSQVLEAIAYSRVDFPGESRIEQDRFNSVAGTISTRTRQKCKKDSVDKNGVIQRARSKYNAEGILAWDYFVIKNIRWNESNIEVEVEKTWYYLHDKSGPPGPRPAGFVPERSWEPVEAVISEGHLYRLYYYYDTLFTETAKLSLAERLQIYTVHPTPQDVMAMAPDLLNEKPEDDRESSDVQRLRYARHLWRVLQGKFIRRLNLDALEAKKQELKEKEEKKKEEKKKEEKKKEEKKKEEKKKEEKKKEEKKKEEKKKEEKEKKKEEKKKKKEEKKKEQEEKEKEKEVEREEKIQQQASKKRKTTTSGSSKRAKRS